MGLYSIDRDPVTYKDFISIIKTYTYRQSSLAYMFVYILITFTLPTPGALVLVARFELHIYCRDGSRLNRLYKQVL